MITDRDVNLLRSCANWLETRSRALYFATYKQLMADYARSLNRIADELAKTAVEKPVTMEEIFFGGKSNE